MAEDDLGLLELGQEIGGRAGVADVSAGRRRLDLGRLRLGDAIGVVVSRRHLVRPPMEPARDQNRQGRPALMLVPT